MQILNIGVIKCDSSKADEMEPAVAAAITKAGLWGKIVGEVSDGGANLLKLWRALKKQGGYKSMGLKELPPCLPFECSSAPRPPRADTAPVNCALFLL